MQRPHLVYALSMLLWDIRRYTEFNSISYTTPHACPFRDFQLHQAPIIKILISFPNPVSDQKYLDGNKLIVLLWAQKLHDLQQIYKAMHVCSPIEVNRRRTHFSHGIPEQRGIAVDCCRGPSGCSVADGRRGAGRRVLHLPRKEQVHSPQVPSNPQGSAVLD